MAGGVLHVMGQKSAGSLAGHFDALWQNLWSRNSSRNASRCPRLQIAIGLVFKKTLYNSEKKHALQIMEDLDHREEDGENLICLPCTAETTPVICVIKNRTGY